MKDLSNENIIHIQKDGVQYIQFRKLLKYDKYIKHAYSIGKNLTFRTNKQIQNAERNIAIDSYRKLCDELNESYLKIVKPVQMHTDEVKVVNRKVNSDFLDINLSEYDNTDGLITNKKDLILSTTSADCISLLFFDPVQKVIANVHSGWRGTVQRIGVKAVKKMVKQFNCMPEDIICCICPSIRKCHFLVKEDVKKIFEENFQDLKISQEIIQELDKDKQWLIDTVLINTILLEKEGLKKENIVDSKICTVCNSQILHSYRVDKENFGLNTALIELI